MKVIFTSGGMDPIHSGHIKYLQDASQYGRVYVLLNSDDWLVRKKGFAFMPFEERREILLAIKFVSGVYEVDDKDGTVCAGLKEYGTMLKNAGFTCVFAKGGDRTAENTPEQSVCKELGIEVLFGIGGGKIQSSSELVRKARSVGTPLVCEDAT